jgi:hypothetical protein
MSLVEANTFLKLGREEKPCDNKLCSALFICHPMTMAPGLGLTVASRLGRQTHSSLTLEKRGFPRYWSWSALPSAPAVDVHANPGIGPQAQICVYLAMR